MATMVGSDSHWGVGQILQIQRGDGSLKCRFPRRGNRQLAGCFTCNTSSEIKSRAIVDRDDDGAAQQAAPKGSHPFGTIGAPKQDAIAGANAALLQIARKAESNCRQFAVSPRFAAISSALHDGHIATITVKFVEQRE